MNFLLSINATVIRLNFFWLLILLVSCTTEPDKVEIPVTEKEYSKPKVVYFNPDSLTVITPGKNGVPLPKTVKAGKPKVVPNRLRSIPAGESTVVKIDTSLLKKITPGENGVPLPKTYTIPDSSYLVQHGDTIYAPNTVTARHPESVKAIPPSFKDNAVYNIQYLDTDHGLPSSEVRSMIEDQKGNIWFGTLDGISRYDGNSFTTYKANDGLANNLVMSLLEDQDGNLWIGTQGGGVSRYDGDSFTTFSQKEGLAGNWITSILEDQEGNLWFGSYFDGVSRYDGNSFTTFRYGEGLANDYVMSILEDQEGNLWFGTGGGGVSRYDGNSFTTFRKSGGLAGNWVTSILEDKAGNLWFGTDGGVSRYDGNTFSSFSEGLGHNIYVRSMLEDQVGNLWINTIAGVSRYDGNSFTTFSETEGLTDNLVWSMLEDQAGNLWFGTNNGGVSRYDQNSFTTFSESEGLSDNVLSILEDQAGNLWFGYQYGGITRYDGNSLTTFSSSEGLPQKYITCMLKDQEGNLWSGGDGGGVSRFDGNTFTSFRKRQGLAHNYVFSMLEDQNGNLWFGTIGGGVSRYNGSSFTTFTESEGLANNFVLSILEDHAGNLWFGSYGGGVSRYDGYSFTTYSESEGLANNFVVSMLEDQEGNIWFGTDGGVSLLRAGTENINDLAFKNYTTEDGLPHNRVMSLLQDHKGRIWIGTSVGGILLLKNPGDEFEWDESNYQVFLKQDGLKSQNITGLAEVLDKHNRIWWATSKGLAMLDLNTLKLPQGVPRMQLNALDIKGSFVDYRMLKDSLKAVQEYRIGKKNKKSLSELAFSGVPAFQNYPENLSLPFDLNHLTFHYSAIEWEAPHKIRYQFKLEGLDDNWNELSKETKAEYRNLSYGNFTFQVKAIGASNNWSETFEYPFTIRPPLWLTIWAKLLWIVLMLGFLFLIYKIRTRALKAQQKKLLEMVDDQTSELKEQSEHLVQSHEELNSAYDQLKELDEHKESMTAMLVHDFKNSLNTVINFSEGTPTERRMKSIRKAGQFMLNMVLNMLDVQKFETTEIKLSSSNLPISNAIHEAVNQLSYMIDEKSIKISHKIDDGLYCNYDYDLTTRIIVNILSNAIKYVSTNGEIGITSELKDSKVVIAVSDNGQGIPADKVEMVFDKYSQINAKASGSIRSTGIGLTFCKMVVEAQGGTIGVESVEGKGSTFWFTLQKSEAPKGSKEEKTDIILDAPTETIIELNEKDKAILQPYMGQLQKLEVYDYSDVKEIILSIEANGNPAITSWLEEMNKAVQNVNEERYHELVNGLE